MLFRLSRRCPKNNKLPPAQATQRNSPAANVRWLLCFVVVPNIDRRRSLCRRCNHSSRKKQTLPCPGHRNKSLPQMCAGPLPLVWPQSTICAGHFFAAPPPPPPHTKTTKLPFPTPRPKNITAPNMHRARALWGPKREPPPVSFSAAPAAVPKAINSHSTHAPSPPFKKQKRENNKQNYTGAFPWPVRAAGSGLG